MRTLLACLPLLAVAFVAAPTGVACSTTSSPTYQAHDDCSRSIAQYCSSAKCTLDYATAKQQAQACAPNTTLSYSFAEHCGGFNVLTQTNVDVGTAAYYDATNGNLVAIVDYSANFGGSRSCVAANAASFTPPDCATVALPCDPVSSGGSGEGGADGGAESDGSLDASSHD